VNRFLSISLAVSLSFCLPYDPLFGRLSHLGCFHGIVTHWSLASSSFLFRLCPQFHVLRQLWLSRLMTPFLDVLSTRGFSFGYVIRSVIIHLFTLRVRFVVVSRIALSTCSSWHASVCFICCHIRNVCWLSSLFGSFCVVFCRGNRSGRWPSVPTDSHPVLCPLTLSSLLVCFPSLVAFSPVTSIVLSLSVRLWSWRWAWLHQRCLVTGSQTSPHRLVPTHSRSFSVIY
jgi:hypothetical protein